MGRYVVLIVGMFALAGCSNGSAPAAAPQPDSGSGSSAPIAADEEVDSTSTGGGSSTSSASCIETYSLDALPNRRFAFDGTVTAIESGSRVADEEAAPVRVEYQVNEWFKGGEGDTVTLQSWDFIVAGGAGDPALDVGTRVLVSGDEDMAWGCGFTREYSARDARAWRNAL